LGCFNVGQLLYDLQIFWELAVFLLIRGSPELSFTLYYFSISQLGCDCLFWNSFLSLGHRSSTYDDAIWTQGYSLQEYVFSFFEIV